VSELEVNDFQRIKMLNSLGDLKNRISRMYGRGQIEADAFKNVIDYIESLDTVIKEVNIFEPGHFTTRPD